MSQGNIMWTKQKASKMYVYTLICLVFFLLGTSYLLQVATTNMLENHFLESMMLSLILKIKPTLVWPGKK